MVNHALKSEIAKAAVLHYKLLDVIDALFEEGSPSGVKAVLEILKIARNNVRLPLAPVSEKHYAKLDGLVKKMK
jgi:4-hydroxy-tetrahydrodipicolinate synthase